jgi:hypothetical protein
MLWQYRTILFEFTKDGLLGDKYVDDEEMEKNLNELGAQEWELVSVSLLQDGLLAFLKRPGQEEEVEVEMPPSRTVASVAPAVVQSRPEVYSRSVIAAEPIEEEEREPIRGLDRQRKSTLQREDTDFVGDIKIS